MGQHTALAISHAGTVDDNLLFWSAGTPYSQTLCDVKRIISYYYGVQEH